MTYEEVHELITHTRFFALGFLDNPYMAFTFGGTHGCLTAKNNWGYSLSRPHMMCRV